MEFIFEYKNGEINLYQGTGKLKDKVIVEKLGWSTSPQFKYVARKVYEVFNKAIIKLSKEEGQKNLVGKLTLNLKYL